MVINDKSKVMILAIDFHMSCLVKNLIFDQKHKYYSETIED